MGQEQQNILRQAEELVGGARQAAYDHPLDNFNRTAKIWEVILGIEVTAEQVGLCMVGLKLAREAYTHKEDNLVDAAGYLHTTDLVIKEREIRNGDKPKDL